MSRLAQLALAVTVAFSSSMVLAADLSVDEIRLQISERQTEFDNYNTDLEVQIATAKRLEQELESLRENAVIAEAERQSALNEMNLQYERIVEDPSLDISTVRQSYLAAVKAHKETKDAITAKYNEWQKQLEEVEERRLSKHSLLNKLEGLKEQLNSARLDRLFSEFNRQEVVPVTHNIACDREETIGKCMERGKSLAKQKASKRFLDQLYEGLSEATEAMKRRPYSDAHVKIIRSDVSDNNFSGLGNYNVSMQVEVKGNLQRNEGCSLLGLDGRYCVADKDRVNVAEVALPDVSARGVQTDESVMYELTVRSNVYDDEVFIDGVSYGSTRLQIMLPAGEHDIEVVKRGYETYRQNVNLEDSRTLKVDLERSQYAFNKGERIQDILVGDVNGPDLVVVPAGGFRMGDIAGTGLDNERPVESKDIPDSFGISETEVTVEQFQHFVSATSYVTEAEQNQGCAYYEGGRPVWQENLNWRSPGYAQGKEHPVVCISLKDAQAYVDWLSTASEQSYRLPSEVEWEYSARSGQESDYWWGEGIGTDNANCGWCGSQWSNVSASPVSSFERNDFGLFDTVGNVWEWTVSLRSQSGAVVRGGAWNFAPKLARVSTRMELDPSFRSNYVGFRVLREQ